MASHPPCKAGAVRHTLEMGKLRHRELEKLAQKHGVMHTTLSESTPLPKSLWTWPTPFRATITPIQATAIPSWIRCSSLLAGLPTSSGPAISHRCFLQCNNLWLPPELSMAPHCPRGGIRSPEWSTQGSLVPPTSVPLSLASSSFTLQTRPMEPPLVPPPPGGMFSVLLHVLFPQAGAPSSLPLVCPSGASLRCHLLQEPL